ncbi:MAG: PAS domain S-box protein [Thermodesulfobacteriota bacterium]
MNFLDMKTIIFNHIVTDIVCTVVIAFLWYRNRKRFTGIGFWLADYAFQVGAVTLVILRGWIPDFISMVIANFFALTGTIFLLIGLEYFVGKRGRQTHNYIYLGIFCLIHFYYTVFQPSLTARSINITFGIMVLTSQCMWLLLMRVDRGLRPMTRGLGIVHGAYSLVSAFRIILILTSPQLGEDFFKTGLLDTLVLLTYQFLFIIQTFGLTLMVSRRLLMDVQSQEERFSKAFHSSPYAITLTRLVDGRIMAVNEGFVKLSGYDYTEVIGKSSLDLDLWAREEDRAAVITELSNHKTLHGAEFQFRTKSGKTMIGIFSADIITINNEPWIVSSINDITERKQMETERERLLNELQETLAKVKTLSGLLPICASCKKIRDDKGYWTQIESYIRRHSDADFSHSICPDCMKKLYPDLVHDSHLSILKVEK